MNVNSVEERSHLLEFPKKNISDALCAPKKGE